jgi:hypothetical protein
LYGLLAHRLSDNKLKLIPKTTKDFGYLKIFDLYTEDELNDIWKEVFHLDYVMDLPKVQKDRGNSSAIDVNGMPKMNGRGAFLDSIYTDRDYSPILKYNRKLFSKEVIESFSNTHPANKVSYPMVNGDTTLLNRYCNSQKYDSHSDQSSFTGLTVLIHDPEKVKGGRLSFTDYNITLGAKHNSCIIFPSWVAHSVSKLKSSEGGRRYSIAQLMFIVSAARPTKPDSNVQK